MLRPRFIVRSQRNLLARCIDHLERYETRDRLTILSRNGSWSYSKPIMSTTELVAKTSWNLLFFDWVLWQLDVITTLIHNDQVWRERTDTSFDEPGGKACHSVMILQRSNLIKKENSWLF